MVAHAAQTNKCADNLSRAYSLGDHAQCFSITEVLAIVQKNGISFVIALFNSCMLDIMHFIRFRLHNYHAFICYSLDSRGIFGWQYKFPIVIRLVGVGFRS